MGKFNEYSQKATPADNDTLMIYDATSKSNKLSPFSGIWNWIVGKLTNAVISNLQTSNQTVLGAINELNSKPQINEFSGNIDSLSGKYIVVANSYATGTLPKNLSGNRYFIMGDSLITSNGIIYGIQMAICFGSNSIAVRNSNYNLDGSKSYGEWRYI